HLREVLLVDLLVETLLRELLFLLRFLLRRDDGDASAVRAPRVILDRGVESEHAPRLSAVGRDHVKRASLVAVSLREKGDPSAVGRPRDASDLARARHEGTRLAVGKNDPELGTTRAARLLPGFARHVERGG